jgi:hypothetical protein
MMKYYNFENDFFLAGSVTIASALSVTNPPNPSTYSLVANVHDTAACAVAACAFSVEVTFTNEVSFFKFRH